MALLSKAGRFAVCPVWLSSSLAVVGLLVCGADVRSAAAAGTPIKVACIGDNTTHSDAFSTRTNQPPGMQEYPAMMQTILGSGYNVMNFGDCCASVISGYTAPETHPFINGDQFGPSQSFGPDIVVIGSWGRHDWGLSAQNALQAFMAGDTATSFTKFQADYDTLVSKYIALPNKPKIFCSTPIPILFGNDGPDNGYKTSPAAAAIKAVCGKYNLPIVDLFTAFLGHKEYYIGPPETMHAEGEHNSPQGGMVIAQMVANAILGMDGGSIVASSSGGGASDGGSMSDTGSMAGSGSSGGGSGGSSSSGGFIGGSSSGSSSGGLSSGSSSGSSSAAAGSSSGGGTTTGVPTGSSGAGTGGSSGTSGTGTMGSGGTGGGTGIDTDAGGGAASSSGGSSADQNGSTGCSAASRAAGRTPWGAAGAVTAVVGWAFLARRRSRRRAANEKNG